MCGGRLALALQHGDGVEHVPARAEGRASRAMITASQRIDAHLLAGMPTARARPSRVRS
jgi:hypothetical protein